MAKLPSKHYKIASTDWVAWTPVLTSGGGGGVTLNATGKTDPNGFWRRIGDSMEVSLSFRNGSGGAASGSAGTLLFSLPAGVTINTAKLETAVGGTGIIGYGSATTGTTPAQVWIVDSTHFRVGDVSGNPISIAALAALFNLDIRFMIPVVGWTSHDFQAANA